MDLLKLIVKEELADIIFARPSQDDEGWTEDSVLVSLRIPTEYLNPICFTLEDMYTDDVCCRCAPSESCGWNDWTDNPSCAATAFARRHLARRHVMGVEGFIVGDYWTAETIKQIYKAPRNETQQADFEKDCREAAHRIGLTTASSTLLAKGRHFYFVKYFWYNY